MFKYALKLTGNKAASSIIVKTCRAKYNRNGAWLAKEKERRQHKISIKKACHNWLYGQMMDIITKKNQKAFPTVINFKRPKPKTKLYDSKTV